jgi:hypothetical protein
MPVLKYLKNFCLLPYRRPECEIRLPPLLLKTRYESNIFVVLSFLLLKEGKAHMKLSQGAHNYPCCQE